jgi:hypothetical protein
MIDSLTPSEGKISMLFSGEIGLMLAFPLLGILIVDGFIAIFFACNAILLKLSEDPRADDL